MNKAQARQLLLLHRPRSGDAQDPQIAEAMELARRDEDLGRWLAERHALHDAVRIKLRQIPVPPDLRARLLTRQPPNRRWPRRPRRAALLAVAASLALFLGLLAFWRGRDPAHPFASFRQRMARTALQNYRMDLVTDDLNQIRQHLAVSQSHGDYELPTALGHLPGHGCAVTRWHDRKVAMVCFDLGRIGDFSDDLYLFVINRADLSDPPPSDKPVFHPISRLMTASWSRAEKTYVLAGNGDEAFLRGFLGE